MPLSLQLFLLRLSLGIPRKECLGLLGINGAGKTSTFAMLTGDRLLTSGDAYLGGYSVKTQTRRAQRLLGYCPQYDALIDQLTGRETLAMFARLRGVAEVDVVCNQLLKDLLLTEHADKQVKAYRCVRITENFFLHFTVIYCACLRDNVQPILFLVVETNEN